MNILAVDTSTRACVLGVRSDVSGEGGENTWTDETVLDRTHSKEILPRIEALLQSAKVDKSELDLLVYGQGPGSFTGLRIGVGVVQGLAYGLGIPVLGVSSLACLAQRHLRQGGHRHAIVALTARHTEVYFGAYGESQGLMQLLSKEGVFEAEEIPPQDVNQRWIGVGGGWQLADSLRRAAAVEVDQVYLTDYPTAVDLLDLGEAGLAMGHSRPAEQALPEYLREQVASKPS
ncbi:MAG: tRNA threonylcarbamoyladenosine biosynthesis protein TsaB [Candidatus Azotimanducaceae bacterium]|jgi:tRNA threonylcarbamoyladenosine biosynthesis protein TsaB